MMKDLSRRRFLLGAASLGAVAAGGALAGCAAENTGASQEQALGVTGSDAPRDWAQEVDVIVVGTGFAGLSAAYEAAKAGSSVLVLEKAPEEHAGGNSRVCAQAVWSPAKTKEGIDYFKEITGQWHLADLPEDVISAYIGGVAENYDWLLDEFDIPIMWHNACEYPAAKTAEAVGEDNTIIPEEGLGNSAIWNPMFEVVSEMEGVQMLFDTPLADLIMNSSGEVIGVEAGREEVVESYKALKGVVLACGGFEFNEPMKANYLHAPSYAWGTPYNTGDAIRICQKYDIDFWHMNSDTNGCRVGFPAPFLEGDFALCSADGEVVGDYGYVWTDKYGVRFMDETRAYQHGYGRDAIFYDDGAKMEFPRLPFWQVFDESALPRLGAGSKSCGWLGLIGGYDTPALIEQCLSEGIILQAQNVAELASKMGVDDVALQASIDSLAAADDEFGRAVDVKRPLSGALYAVQLYPVMVNTNGGPRRNADAAIVRCDGTAVPRLYSAGELGGVWAYYYQGAGNTSECMVFGRIAGRNVSALEPWEATAEA